MHVYLYKTSSRQPPAFPAPPSPTPFSASEPENRESMSASTDRDQQRQRTSTSSVSTAAGDSASNRHLDYRNDPIVFNRYYSQNELDVFPIRMHGSDNSGGADFGLASSVDIGIGLSNSLASSVTRCRHANWEECEEQRLRELEEAKARASQMEKTMKWWSACTANWREKWSRVRDERNKYRDEIRQLRAKLERSQADVIQLQLEKRESAQERQQLHAAMEKLKQELSEKTSSLMDIADQSKNSRPVPSRDFGCQCYIPERWLASSPLCGSLTTTHKEIACNTDEIWNGKMAGSGGERLDEITERNLHMLKNRMEDTMRLLKDEREERSKVNKRFTEMESEMKMLRAKCDELEASKQASIEELEELKSLHTEALQKLKRARASPTASDHHLRLFGIEDMDNAGNHTNTHPQDETFRVLLEHERRLEEAMQLEQRLRSDNSHLREQIDELAASLQASQEEGNTWKDECSALREANTKLASRLECLELSTISSLEGSDQNDE